MIVCFSHAKVGHCQAIYSNKNTLLVRVFLFVLNDLDSALLREVYDNERERKDLRTGFY